MSIQEKVGDEISNRRLFGYVDGVELLVEPHVKASEAAERKRWEAAAVALMELFARIRIEQIEWRWWLLVVLVAWLIGVGSSSEHREQLEVECERATGQFKFNLLSFRIRLNKIISILNNSNKKYSKIHELGKTRYIG